MHVREPQEVALGLLKEMCQTSPTGKAIILTGSSKSGREIVSKRDKSFEVTCIDDRMPLAEEVEQTLSFASHSEKRLLISTRLVTEGLDIPSLKMVLVLDVWPSLLEYIHAVAGYTILEYFTTFPGKANRNGKARAIWHHLRTLASEPSYANSTSLTLWSLKAHTESAANPENASRKAGFLS